MDFKVFDGEETRSDNVNLKNYNVSLNNKRYILNYDGENLREVYFMDRFKSYFLSCRTDFTIISHYYLDGTEIRRYENGKLNMIYTTDDIYTRCFKNGKNVVYTVNKNVQHKNPEKLKTDLLNFLTKFNESDFERLAIPVEPTDNNR